MCDDELLRFLLPYWAVTTNGIGQCEKQAENKALYRLITVEGNVYFLKEVGSIEKRDEYRLEKVLSDYALLQHLFTQGVPVAVPILTLSGLPYVQVEDRFYSLLPALPVFHTQLTPAIGQAMFLNLGIAIGRLHQALKIYPGQIHSWKMDLAQRTFDEAVPVLLNHLNEAGRRRLRAALESIEDPTRKLLNNLPAQHIHGDCHGGNVLFNGEQVSGFIDLDHLQFGPRIYDIGYFLADWIKNRYRDPSKIELLSGTLPYLLQGYDQVILLRLQEKQALIYTILATQIIFSAWFFEPLSQPDLAQFNLDAFYWIFENKGRISIDTYFIDKISAPAYDCKKRSIL